MPTNAVWKYFASFILALIIGINIFSRVDLPPYGAPINELSDNYWGVIVDIAHRWRSFDVSLWNRELGAGISLFSTGQYPVLNPTNFLAWFVNDDVFMLIKLIEPYVMGIFFMMVLLWDVFKTRWYIALFGGLSYMGLLLSKATTMAESPYFLYACGLFPLMVLVMMKLRHKHIYLTAAAVGCLIAVQFIGEGVTQIPQLVIWWVLFLLVGIIGQWVKHNYQHPVRYAVQGIMASGIVVISTITAAAVQFLPTLHYFRYESSRSMGYYIINNFKLFGERPPSNNLNFDDIVFKAFFESGMRSQALLIIIGILVALAIVHMGRIFVEAKHHKIIYQLWTTTIIYFLLPSCAGLITDIFPATIKLLSFMSYFNFGYGLHILDCCIILTLCLMIDDDRLVLLAKHASPLRKIIAGVCLGVVMVYALLPTMIELWPSITNMAWIKPISQYIKLPSLKKANYFALSMGVLIVLLAFRPWRYVRHILLIYVLVGLGFMMTLDCFKWYDKGCRTHVDQYQLNSPEHTYYREAKGKFIMPYTSMEPVWAIHNYNLLHGVKGTSGFMALGPTRLDKFAFYYNHKNSVHKDASFKGNSARFISLEGKVPATLTTYFPIDFTLVRKDHTFSWPGFERVIKGDVYDVYARQTPTARVYFANQLEVASLAEVIGYYDRPRSEIVYVSDEDAKAAQVVNRVTAPHIDATYTNFVVTDDSKISFQLTTTQNVFVIVPERFDRGWQVKVDGKEVPFFAAHYLFIGFQVTPGEHRVEMTYTPPWLWIGIVLNIVALGGLMWLFKKYWPLKNP